MDGLDGCLLLACQSLSLSLSLWQVHLNQPTTTPTRTHNHTTNTNTPKHIQKTTTKVVIDALEDELFDMEDELDLAAEEAYLADADDEAAAMAPVGGGGGGAQTMADLERGGAPRE
jgi:hypothetical protein